MLILGINRLCNWCQITTAGRRYTCPTKMVDGKFCFRFKNSWHLVADYVSEHTTELVKEGGETISRIYKK